MQELLKDILLDGIIDSSEVVSLEAAIFADGTVDEEELRAMGELNEKATTKCPEFGELFTKVVKAYALEDDNTPGVIDADEAAIILEVVNNDGVVDDIEKAAILAVCGEATSIDSAELTALWDSLK